MKKTLVALASMPVLSLITAIALADVSGIPNPSGNGIVPTDGEIKNRNQCDGAAFFKNVFPSLTNGGPDGSDFVDLTVDGETVRVEVTWYAENYFSFATNGAYLKKVGVTVDRNNFIFDYTGNELDGIADTQLNYYTDSITGAVLSADDVNHLDLCVVTVDDDAPDVSEIRVEPSSDGTTVSGEITISTDIADESDQSVLIEIFQIVNGEEVSIDTSLIMAQPDSPCDSGAEGCTEYSWTLNTSLLAEGEYTIRVTSADQTVLALETIRTKDITVVRSLLDCLDDTDGTPGIPTGPSNGGCNQTGAVQAEWPSEIRPYVGSLTVTQEFVPARTDIDVSSAFCDSSTYPNIAHDPRVSYSNGVNYIAVDDPMTIEDERALDLADLFQIPAGSVVLGAENVGSPCLALVTQDAPDFSDIAALLPPDFTYSEGPTNTVTQYPAAVDGMFANIPQYTAPLNYCDPTFPCYQPDPQNVAQAAYQPDDRFDLVLPFAQAFTYFNYNPSRVKTFKGSKWPINTREVCPDIDIVDPPTAAYIEEVYQCKIDLALRYEQDTRHTLEEAEAVGSLISPSLNNLLNWLNRAQSQIRNSHFERCVSNLQRLENNVIDGIWNDVMDPVDGDFRNDQGRILMYVKNLIWRCEQLQLTEDFLDSLP